MLATGTQTRAALRDGLGAMLRAPWSASAWLATAHVLVGWPVALVSSVTVAALAGLSVSLAIVAPLGAIAFSALLGCTRAFAAVQRSRFAAFLGVRIAPAAPPRSGTTWLRRLWAEARAPSTWRQLAYQLLALPISTFGSVVVVAGWSVGITLSTAPTHGWPDRGLFGWNLRDPVTLAALTGTGLVVFFAAPWLARAAAAVDVLAARALLGTSRSRQLARRVESLTASRAGVVDATDAERRRIERDLHDGTQQRLTSLAIKLGVARETLVGVPEPARATIAGAHEEAILALAELRDVVRGLHPAVLDDRGLDAALSGIAARAPVPVELRVDLPERPSPTIEAVAYFVVSEALTNIAKHANASNAQISVERMGDRLRLVIADDGAGGADPHRGTGLRGLTQRVAAVDGTLRIESPAGGPTTITVDLPCES